MRVLSSEEYQQESKQIPEIKKKDNSQDTPKQPESNNFINKLFSILLYKFEQYMVACSEHDINGLVGYCRMFGMLKESTYNQWMSLKVHLFETGTAFSIDAIPATTKASIQDLLDLELKIVDMINKECDTCKCPATCKTLKTIAACCVKNAKYLAATKQLEKQSSDKLIVSQSLIDYING